MEYMSWLQVLTIAGSTIGCCWYFRRETKEEIAEMKAEAREARKEAKEFREMWAQESKDFHGRLCKIEEERTRRLFLRD